MWTVTTIWQFSMNKVPPALVSLARQQGLKPPVNGQPFIHHICMTPYEADGRQSLHLNSFDLDCSYRTVDVRRGVMTTENICHGPVEGVVKGQVTFRGNTHFEGNTDFRGKYRGDPARMRSSFTADWAGEDCRGVRPFIPQNN
ncbi:MAG: DUF3617 family protein [Alphaproteobacteria bacterium]